MSNLKTTSHYFIFVSAKNCPHCTSFKDTQWSNCKELIEQLNTVKIIEIELDKLEDNIKFNDYPLDLKKYCKWYPIFLLVPAQSWNNSVSDRKRPLQNLKIYNGLYDSSKDIYKHKDPQQSQPINAKSLSTWVASHLLSNTQQTIPNILVSTEQKSSEFNELIPTAICRQIYKSKNK